MSENSANLPVPSGVNVPERVRLVLHECEDICDKLVKLGGVGSPDAAPQAEALIAAYLAVELPEEYAEIMDKKFAAARQTFTEESANLVARQEKRVANVAALNDLLIENARFSTSVRLLPLRREFAKVRKQWQALAAETCDIDAINNKFTESFALIDRRLEQESAAAETALAALNELVVAMEAMQNIPPEEFRKKREEFDAIRLSIKSDADADDDRVKKGTAEADRLYRALNDRLTLHYQTLDLARWESYTLKMDLCNELEKMQPVADSDMPKAATRLRDIRKRWQDLGAVPREKQHELGPRFYEYTTALQRRIDEFYKQQRLARTESVTKKTALCEAAESVAASTEWNATAEKLKTLQLEWKNAGNAGRDADKALYARFRAACDTFFNARNAYWESKQQQHAAAAAVKEELCAAAAKLTELPPSEAVREAKLMRTQYQSTPHAGKQEQELNGRFNASLEQFFGGRRAAIDEANHKREELLTALGAFTPDGSVSDAEKEFESLRNAWRELPMLPRDIAAATEAKYKKAVAEADKKLSALRKQQQEARADLFIPAQQALAEALTAARNGAPLPEISFDLTLFPKLAALATDLAGVGLNEEMEKAIQRNTRELTSLLEELAAKEDSDNSAVDLAAELAAAIAQNFGSAVFTARKPDRHELLRKVLSVGMVDPAALPDLAARYARLNGKKQ